MSRYLLSSSDAKSAVHYDSPRVVLFSVYQYRQTWLDRLHKTYQLDEVLIKDIWSYTNPEQAKAVGKEWFPETVRIHTGKPGDSKAELIMYGEDKESYILWSAEVWPVVMP